MSGRRCDAVVAVSTTQGVEALCPRPATWALLPSGWGWCDEHMEQLAAGGDDVRGYERVDSDERSAAMGRDRLGGRGL